MRLSTNEDDPPAMPREAVGPPATLYRRSAGGGLDAKVLTLNKFYAPIRVITARRALCLLFTEHAEVICVEDGQYLTYDLAGWLEIAGIQWEIERDRHDWVRCVRYAIAVPRVIRLYSYDRIPRERVRLTRRNVFARERNVCMYCAGQFPTSELTVDHVVPRSQGGRDTWSNLVTACKRCNTRKGGRTPEQAGMRLVRQPRVPRRNPTITARLASERYASWRPFLRSDAWMIDSR